LYRHFAVDVPFQWRCGIGGVKQDAHKERLRRPFHLNGLSVFLHLRPFCCLSAASGQQGYPQHQCHKLYETYAPYVQAQLPDVNIEFIVGNNDLDFYKFLQENGGLPDIITSCRFSLHDAAPLKDSLMNLATTNEAGAVYNAYLNSFKNETRYSRPAAAPGHRGHRSRTGYSSTDTPEWSQRLPGTAA